MHHGFIYDFLLSHHAQLLLVWGAYFFFVSVGEVFVQGNLVFVSLVDLLLSALLILLWVLDTVISIVQPLALYHLLILQVFGCLLDVVFVTKDLFINHTVLVLGDHGG